MMKEIIRFCTLNPYIQLFNLRPNTGLFSRIYIHYQYQRTHISAKLGLIGCVNLCLFDYELQVPSQISEIEIFL